MKGEGCKINLMGDNQRDKMLKPVEEAEGAGHVA